MGVEEFVTLLPEGAVHVAALYRAKTDRRDQVSADLSLNQS